MTVPPLIVHRAIAVVLQLSIVAHEDVVVRGALCLLLLANLLILRHHLARHIKILTIQGVLEEFGPTPPSSGQANVPAHAVQRHDHH